MATSILIAYATKYGSTAEVAEFAGGRLRELGHQAEVRPARDVHALDGYGAVLVAAPYYIGSILKDARAFLDTHRKALEAMPVAFLTLGPLRSSDDMAQARAQIDKTLVGLPWFQPVAAEMFVGKYDPAKLRFPDSLAAKVKGTPLWGVGAHDDRDWDAIRAWVDGLPAAMGLG